MPVDGVLAQHQRCGNLGICPAPRNETQDLLLSGTEFCAPAGRTARLKLAGAALLACRAKLVKRSVRSVKLRPCRIVAPKRAQRASECNAPPAGFERESCVREQSTASSNACRAAS